MLFNSLDFAIFLPIVFFLYWQIGRKGVLWQNGWLVLSSFIFYGWWDWRYLLLLISTSGIDFLIAIGINESQSIIQKKRWLLLSAISNLGVLGIFKYFDFFIESAVQTLSFLGYHWTYDGLKLILPVGISFYTFQALSYTIDVYRGHLVPTKHPIHYFAYISFFPQLVAGPIERATHFLPQIQNLRTFNASFASSGLRLMLWGFFKKMVVADQCAILVNQIFVDSGNISGSTALLGAILFGFQIYGDFSGYSDIAIGTARLFGFELMHNFKTPYFSRAVQEFWRRWHISLSTWFRDYLYFPMGGSKKGIFRTYFNFIVLFLMSGLWHGAKWTFVLWGCYHALLMIIGISLGKIGHSDFINDKGSFVVKIFKVIATFLGVNLGWIFFRSEDVHQALNMLNAVFSKSLFLSYPNISLQKGVVPIGFILVLLGLEWYARGHQDIFSYLLGNKRRAIRWTAYTFFIFLILMYMNTKESPFIYFQF